MRVYISGQITGLSKEVYEENFKHAASLVEANNMEPVNPVEVVLDMCEGVEACGGEGEIHHWKCYMKHDLIELLKCDAIVMQPNWTGSSGASFEAEVADRLSMPMYAISSRWTEIYEWRHCE